MHDSQAACFIAARGDLLRIAVGTAVRCGGTACRCIWKDLIECLRIQLQLDGSIGQGDVAAARYTERGTSEKAFRGSGPTGKSYEITAMEWFEVRDGLIYRRWGARDSAAMMRQLGLASP